MVALAPDDTRVVPRVSRRSAPLLVPDRAELERLADQHPERELQGEPDKDNGPHHRHGHITLQSQPVFRAASYGSIRVHPIHTRLWAGSIIWFDKPKQTLIM